ncbi:unnamed protein product [Triticum turgidum subsp. durum]|uniref:NB-ARC domain-containing protein n=1 Tax=Triticum turgidum subsp. durum TaxID=4567 RepID=A0A9R1PBU4_TRITD|nr:unnamed protein product [Triticum turgidum subsp. durum]
MVVVGELGVGVSVMGWFLAPHITKLMEIARECAASKCMLYGDSTEMLQKLADDLYDIKWHLDPHSTDFVNDQGKLDRLWRLKDDVHRVEEILDLFQLEIHDIETTGNYITRNKKRLHGKKVELSRQLVKVLKNLDETRDRARELRHGAGPSMSPKAETGQHTMRDKRSFFGYQDEYAQLVSMLWPQQNGHKLVKVDAKARRVIAIVGHAGMGKTELARQVFRDAKGKFDLCIWVHAYGKNKELDLLKEIWRSADRPVGDMNVSSLQKKMENLLASKRCLLVLDDVWNHELATNEEEREQASLALESIMSFAQGGSRIVMTTRAKICSVTFKAAASIILNGIKPKEMTLLLNHTAKLRTDGTIDNDDKKIQQLVNKQVSKMKGSPLAAVEIGHELRKQTTVDKRCDILHNVEHHLDTVLQAHLFTYRHLLPRLQRCFEFCSIFPYNWRFEAEKLTKMWIAHGFVEEDAQQEGRSMEDVATDYFHSLVDRSLFQEEGGEPAGGNGTTYVIHEQVHWMIRMASTKNCISISGTAVRSIPPTVRHLSVTSSSLDQLKAYPKIIVLSNMRTLLVLQSNHGDDDDDDSTSSTPLISTVDRVLQLTRVYSNCSRA